MGSARYKADPPRPCENVDISVEDHGDVLKRVLFSAGGHGPLDIQTSIAFIPDKGGKTVLIDASSVSLIAEIEYVITRITRSQLTELIEGLELVRDRMKMERIADILADAVSKERKTNEH